MRLDMVAVVESAVRRAFTASVVAANTADTTTPAIRPITLEDQVNSRCWLRCVLELVWYPIPCPALPVDVPKDRPLTSPPITPVPPVP